MFTDRVRLLDNIRAPKDGLVTGPWLAQFLQTIKETIGDCNAPLTHRGPITLDRPDTLLAPNGQRLTPIQPYPYSGINPSNTDRPSEQASFTFHGGDSYLNLDDGSVNNGLNIYADGANYIEQLVVGDLVVNNNAQFNGECEGCTGGDGGEPTIVVGAEPVRFILTSTLTRAESGVSYATANILSVVGGVESVISAATVCSWSNQWYGHAGARGWAVLKNDSKNDNGTAGSTYHILWLDTWFMRVILQGDLSLGGDCQVQQVVGVSNTPVGPAVTAVDAMGNKKARNGALAVVAQFQDRPGEFCFIDVQQDAEWIVVTALGDGGGPSLTGEMVRWARGRAPKAVGETITVWDPDGQFGFVKTGAKLRCEYRPEADQYDIVQATVDVLTLSDFRFNSTDNRYEYKTRNMTVWASSDESDWVAVPPMSLQSVSVMTDWQISGFDYQGKFRTLSVPKADDEGDWVTLETGEEC